MPAEKEPYIVTVDYATANSWRALLQRNTEPAAFEGYRQTHHMTGKVVIVQAPNGAELFRYPEDR